MKRNVAAAAVVATVAVLAACGGPQHGTVIDKSHHKGYSYMTMQPIFGYKGQLDGEIPEWHYVPPDWQIELRACTGLGGDRKCQTGWRDVDRRTYDHVKIGQNV